MKNKYQREIKPGVFVDVYDVLKAFKVECPAVAHAVKKALAPGQRGHKDKLQDMREVVQSMQRAIELEEGEPKVDTDPELSVRRVSFVPALATSLVLRIKGPCTKVEKDLIEKTKNGELAHYDYLGRTFVVSKISQDNDSTSEGMMTTTLYMVELLASPDNEYSQVNRRS